MFTLNFWSMWIIFLSEFLIFIFLHGYMYWCIRIWPLIYLACYTISYLKSCSLKSPKVNDFSNFKPNLDLLPVTFTFERLSFSYTELIEFLKIFWSKVADSSESSKSSGRIIGSPVSLGFSQFLGLTSAWDLPDPETVIQADWLKFGFLFKNL